MTIEDFFLNKIKELHPSKEVITLSQELITAEQSIKWLKEFMQLNSGCYNSKHYDITTICRKCNNTGQVRTQDGIYVCFH